MSSPVEAAPTLHQLRFVFKGSAPYLCFVPDVTSGDIARLWAGISHRHSHAPVAIDLTLAPAAPLPNHTPAAPLPSHTPAAPLPRRTPAAAQSGCMPAAPATSLADGERAMNWLPAHLPWRA